MRIKAFPFGPQVKAFLDAHPRIFVVEQNRDAQLRTLLTAETGFPRDAMIPVLDYGGLPLTARVVVDAVAAGVKVPRRSPLDQADLQTQVQQVPA
jgi:2-oxoglutarate ferredoxin oxidoreductase subunit alpha